MFRGGPAMFRGGAAMFTGGPAMFRGGPYDFSDSPGIWNLDWTLALGLSILLSNPFLVRKYFFLIINCQA